MRAWNLGFAATVLAGCAGGAGRAGFVAVPGGRIWYHEAGGGRSIPLLVIHGGPGGRSCRLAAFDRLGRERRVVRYDQLGTGRSDRPVDTTLWRLPRFVEEIDSLRRRLGLVEVHLLGQDRKSTRLNSSHLVNSYAVFCLKKKKSKPSSKEHAN